MSMFFDVLRQDLSATEQQELLVFWTGLANLPLGGFASLHSKPQLWCANEGAGKVAETDSTHCFLVYIWGVVDTTACFVTFFVVVPCA